MKTTAFTALSQSQVYEQKLSTLYGIEQLSYQKDRYLRLAQRFTELFPSHDEFEIFSASGRIEVGGNHTGSWPWLWI
jgi:galactokinase